MTKKMNMDRKKKKEKRNEIIRWIIYYLIAGIGYIFMSTGKVISVSDMGRLPMPLVLIPIAAAAAVYESASPFYSALFGCVCGLLTDSASGTLVSFNGIIIGFCSMIISLVFLFYMRRRILNFILLCFGASLIQSSLHYIFFYLLWGYDPDSGILTGIFIPEFIFTNISGIFIYLLFKLIDRFFGAVREHYIEDSSEAITRE